MRNDPVDRALDSLQGRTWPVKENPQQLELLMRSFATQQPASFFTRHRVLVPVLMLLVLTSVGFAAAGGLNLIRSLFVTVTVNGEVVHDGEVVTDENGTATFTVPVPPPTGDQTTLEVWATGEPVPEGTQVDITFNSDGEQATVTIKPAEEQE